MKKRWKWFVMTVNKPATIKCHWESKQYIGEGSIINLMSVFGKLITHFKKPFSEFQSNDATQSVNEHKVKFKEQ